MSDASRVAIACCRASAGAASTNLYPDPDSELLVERLRALGVDARLVAWDNEEVDWADFASVIIRSTWDGIDRPGEYLDWARRVEASTNLHNSASIIEWNIDKRYLRDLAADGVPTIPTLWLGPGESWGDGTAPVRVADLPAETRGSSHCRLALCR